MKSTGVFLKFCIFVLELVESNIHGKIKIQKC